MTVALDSEIVATRYDAATRTCYYTIERDGRRWTAAVPLADLEVHKANRMNRRNHVANVLQAKMSGPHDVEKEETDATKNVDS